MKNYQSSQLQQDKGNHAHMLILYLYCGSSLQEDSEDGEMERRPSEELVSEAEPATEDGEVQLKRNKIKTNKKI